MKRKALIIGVNQYKGDIICPQNSLKDAKEIARLIETFGQFDEVHVLLNGVDQDNNPYEPQDIKKSIEQLFHPIEKDIETALLYFSGNGAGILGAAGEYNEKGDLLLTDFPLPITESDSTPTSKTFPKSQPRTISLRDLHDLLETSSVRQQIVWLDSDLSGYFIGLFSKTSIGSNYNRCFITSTSGIAEEGPDHGLLTNALLQCLNPTKQIKNSITSYDLKDVLLEEFHWQESLIKNIGDPIPLIKRNFRAQRPWNDLAEGDDFLNIKSEVSALADMLLLRDLKPPFVVGILGGWGSGKSFIMNLMQQRMNEIRSKFLTEEQAWGKEEKTFPYVGHIYQIKFDAWTYAKADLWYSLTQTIFDEFNRQYTLEKQLESLLKYIDKSQLDGGKFWQALSAMNEYDRALYQELPKDIYQKLEKIKFGPEWKNCLRIEINKLREHEKSELEDLDRKYKEEKQKLRRSIFWRTPVYFLQKNWLLFIAFLAGLAITVFPLLPTKLKEQFPKELSTFLSTNQITTMLSGSAATFITGINLWQKTREEQEKVLTHLKKFTGEAQNKIEVGKDVLVTLQQEVLGSDPNIKQQLNEMEQIQDKMQKLQEKIDFTSTYPSLNTFIQGLPQDKFYEDKLGYLHQLQRKLSELTNCFYCNLDLADCNEDQLSKLKETFPRGQARIVLFIDDLDRCPPERVVEVLEAVQLLVKTPLFIAVLAIDERYITRALEKHYEGVLIRKGKPSGTDYLEKIIQIPYRVRPIARSALFNYLDKQMEVERKLENSTVISKAITGSPQEQKAEVIATERDDKPFAAAQPEPAEDLTLDTLKFTEIEFDALLKCCQQIELSPRMIKRLINIYKIFKISEFHSNKVGQKTDKQAEIILSVLALSARYPDLTRELFENLEIEFEELETLENDFKRLKDNIERLQKMKEKGQVVPVEELKTKEVELNVKETELENKKVELGSKKMLEFFPDLSLGNSDVYIRQEYKRSDIDAKTLLKDVTLAEFNLETFLLVRSFCFFGDIGYSPDDSHKSLDSHPDWIEYLHETGLKP